MANQTQKTTDLKPGTERARDEQRDDAGPQYHGESWKGADVGDRDTAPSTDADPETVAAEDDGEVESGGQHAGMGRGEKPRKLKSEEK